jgi:hypothetical protein
MAPRSTSSPLFVVCAALLAALRPSSVGAALVGSLTLRDASKPLAPDRPPYWLSGNLDMADIAKGMDFADPVLIKLTQQVRPAVCAGCSCPPLPPPQAAWRAGRCADVC